MRRKGFTLIELIMVIVIIGILAAIAVPRFVNLRQSARQAQCQGSVGAIRAALSNYYAYWSVHSAHYNGAYPALLSSLTAYYQDSAEPASPGWTDSDTDWQSFYAVATGTMNMGNGCNIARF